MSRKRKGALPYAIAPLCVDEGSWHWTAIEDACPGVDREAVINAADDFLERVSFHAAIQPAPDLAKVQRLAAQLLEALPTGQRPGFELNDRKALRVLFNGERDARYQVMRTLRAWADGEEISTAQRQYPTAERANTARNRLLSDLRAAFERTGATVTVSTSHDGESASDFVRFVTEIFCEINENGRYLPIEFGTVKQAILRAR